MYRLRSRWSGSFRRGPPLIYSTDIMRNLVARCLKPLWPKSAFQRYYMLGVMLTGVKACVGGTSGDYSGMPDAFSLRAEGSQSAGGALAMFRPMALRLLELFVEL